MSHALQRCETLHKIGYFGGEDIFRPDAWLGNFRPTELPYAERILENIIYVNQSQIRSLVKDALSSLSRVALKPKSSDESGKWESFRKNFYLVGISDPKFSGGESSPIYTRIAKKTCQVLDSQIVSPGQAISNALQAAGDFVFIDDAIGSGQQFVEFWFHKWHTEIKQNGQLGKSYSFSDAANHWKQTSDLDAPPRFYYIPLFASIEGIKKIRADCPNVTLLPIYEIDNSYSARSPDSLIWKGSNFSESDVARFINTTSRRAGITHNVWGHEQLGLCLALETGIPDFTLPLLTWEGPNWRALFKDL